MADPALDQQERLALCSLFGEVGASAPTLIEGWSAHDLAAHMVIREHDLLAGPCMVLPGPFQDFAEQHRAKLADSSDFARLVAQIQTGPPAGFFRIRWVRSLANLNEFFVHHEDVRRANGQRPRTLSADLDAALWRNVRRSSRVLARRLRGAGLDLEWLGTGERVRARSAEPRAVLSGAPGEVLLYVFGRQSAADVVLSGSSDAIEAVQHAHFGM